MERSGFRNISNYRTGLTREELMGTATPLPKANRGHRLLKTPSGISMENQESSKWNKYKQEQCWQRARPSVGSAAGTRKHSIFPQSATGTPASVTPVSGWGNQLPRKATKGRKVAVSECIPLDHTHVCAGFCLEPNTQ